ncbi:MAG: hypothetical protein CM1200mP29_06090 [Verrucomicrobiota bacterium]|nr:MAG: hypothetical protein CM1200mP29_06090 [Verrucomicrobiota bacterium]
MSDTEKPERKGLEGVVAATTKLSSVRGLDGELIYRGYNINELAGKQPMRKSSICCIAASCQMKPN